MADIEKVIKGLEHCAVRHKCNNECPYSNIIQDQNEGMDSCVTQLSKDALELLKEQQKKICEYEGLRKPKEPTAVMKIKKSDDMFGGYCPCCEGTVFSVYGNCPACGQALLWMMDKYRKDGEQE